MRFLFYDKVTQIDKGKSIVGVKSFALSEEFLKGHFSKSPVVPGVIFVEAMAQLLGWLINYSHDFKLTAVMSLIGDVDVPANLRPGFEAEIRGNIISTSKKDSLGRAEVYINGKLIASMGRIIYSHVNMFAPDELLKIFHYYSGIRELPQP